MLITHRSLQLLQDCVFERLKKVQGTI